MTAMQKAAQEDLRRLVEQIERLEEEKAALAADIRDKLTEAKNSGFDTKIIKKCLNIRKKPKADHEEEQAILDLYLHALGMAPAPMDFGAREPEEAHA